MEILVALFGGLNIVQLVISFRTMKSQVRKDEYLAEKEKFLTEKEKANSVEASQHIFDLMTERVKKELEEVYAKIGQQDETIKLLHKIVNQYKTNCAQCAHNKLTS